jgi:serine/threonine protein kinase
LASILEKQKYFDEAAAASVMWQLLGLLNHCHKRGIIHSDLKLTSVSFNSKKQELIRVDDLSISRIFRIEEII